MKIFRYLFVQIIVFAMLFCGQQAEFALDESRCPDKPELIVKNISGYTADEVYMHDQVGNYLSGQLLITDMPDGGLISVDVTDGLVKYFTFIRNITSTSTTEIAVTTAEPVTFSRCYKYTLNLLPEDYFLEDDINYLPVKFSENQSKTIGK